MIRTDPLEVLTQSLIKRQIRQRGAIANNDQATPGAGQGDVGSANVGEEADLALGVAERPASATPS
jgi:hypothetical protein